MLTPKFVINLFLVCFILFLPIGIILYFTSNNIYEFQYDYTDCVDLNDPNQTTCHEKLTNDHSYVCKCRVHFYENQFQDETLHVYYMLENYYQNHRRYVKSRDYDQLLGGRTGDYLSNECEPFRYYQKSNNLKLKYAPCGAISNSMFNDSFSIYYIQKNTNESIKLNISKANLAWNSDREYKFKNPPNYLNTIKPPNWPKNISLLENGYQNEALMVWMRTAAFPSFRKLYGRILLEENSKLMHTIQRANRSSFMQLFRSNQNLNEEENNEETNKTIVKSFNYIKMNQNNSIIKYRLPKGLYFVDIEYKYLVKQFQGRKYFILANISWIGGKCYFMALAYIIFGCICFVAAIVLFFLHVYFGNMHYNTAILLVDTTTSLVK